MTWIRRILLALGTTTATMLSTAALSDDALERAISLTSEERYPEARLLLDPLLESEQPSAHVRLLDGILRVYEGSREEAAVIFVGLTREFPDLFEAHNNLAVLHAEDGRLNEARATLLFILERRPEAVGYRNLGDIYVQLARHAYARGRELDPAGGEPAVQGQDMNGEPPLLDVSAAPAESGNASTRPGGNVGGAAGGLARANLDAGDLHVACMVTGEFTDPSAAYDAQQLLLSYGGEILEVRQEQRQITSDYRVYMPPLESRKSAKQRMRALRSEGIRDVSVILHGPLRNAISLGVYSDKRNVNRRMARLERLGYSVRLADNTTRLEEYTVIEVRVNGTRDALRDAWAAHFPEQPIQHVECA